MVHEEQNILVDASIEMLTVYITLTQTNVTGTKTKELLYRIIGIMQNQKIMKLRIKKIYQDLVDNLHDSLNLFLDLA